MLIPSNVYGADYSASSTYGVGTTYNSIFEGFCYDLDYGDNYVFWRDSQYVYCFCYGDISVSGTTFSGTDCTIVTYTISQSSGSNQSAPTISTSTLSDFSLTTGGYLVYSNLDGFPSLVDSYGGYYALVIAVILCSFFLLYIFNRLRSYLKL